MEEVAILREIAGGATCDEAKGSFDEQLGPPVVEQIAEQCLESELCISSSSTGKSQSESKSTVPERSKAG